MEAVDLARWQFGITTVYHFFFVPITIGLTWLVAFMQTKWSLTGDEGWLRLTKLFGKLFLINFAAGVVTGIVQEFQFGMNWSEYSRFVGDIFGAPLALEALIAFFMESTFIGLWIFGWDKLPKRLHLATSYLVAIGSTISSIFILAANAWMQHPVGAVFENGRAELDDFLALLTNPFFLTMLPHTLAAAFIVSGGLLLGVAGYWWAKSQPAAHRAEVEVGVEGKPLASDGALWQAAAKLGAGVVVIACVVGIGSGHLTGQVSAVHQPAKLAAMEGLTSADDSDKFSLVAWFNKDANGEVTKTFEVALPIKGLVPWLAYGDTTATVQGANDIRADFVANGYRTWDGTQWGAGTKLQSGYAAELDTSIDPIPTVAVSYYAFRVMVGLGMLGLIIAVALWFRTRRAESPRPTKIWQALMVFVPLWPLLANIAGWLLAEVGRQPWIVYGVLSTESAVSPHVSALEIGLTLTLYTLVYAVVAVVVVGAFLAQIRKGLPEAGLKPPADAADRPLRFAY
ncbi:MAG: cytochrome ubiquinol oxidase subunit I [Propionibacteriaceae bacterium]|jgi:cytochrome d ubiquinol oxidase subunit I|nr:cytochrome ubiquinol oxidase subunit I [Propionibacteriaceae bacterium]